MTNNNIPMSIFVNYIKKYVPDPIVIVDLGAMDAKDSMYFKTCFPKARVYAIEGLKENYNLFKDVEDIIPINTVVCNLDGDINFYKKNVNGIHSIYNRGDIYGLDLVKVKCYKFKTLINNVIKEDSLDVLKIDVEGATYDVLLSMEDYIHNIGIMHIETETVEFFKNQALEHTSFEYLKQHGFEMMDRKCCEIEKDGLQCDSVWLNRRFCNERLVS